ncbi:MAG: hypothetical protein L3K15_04995, partial [Thermoplasmata archaeon]|nr:hypothetical protein [Thermoplasmata archaeon]
MLPLGNTESWVRRHARLVVAAIVVLTILSVVPLAERAGPSLVPTRGHVSGTAAPHATLAARLAGIHPGSAVLGPFNGHYFRNLTYTSPGDVTNSAFADIDTVRHVVFATNGVGSDLAAFWESNGTLIARVAAGNPLAGETAGSVAVDPVSHTVFVAVGGGGGAHHGFVRLYNETTLQPTGNVTLAGSPRPDFQPFLVTYDSASNQVFAVNYSDGYIAAIDGNSGIVTTWVACPVLGCIGNDLVAVPNLHELALAAGQNAIVLYNTTNDHVVTTLSSTVAAFVPIALAYIPSSFTLLAANYSTTSTLFFRFNLATNLFAGSLSGDPGYANWIAYDATDNAILVDNFSTNCPGVVICTYGYYSAVELIDAGTGVELGHAQALGPFGAAYYKMALDAGTSTVILPGSESAPTAALHLPTLAVTHLYSAYPTQTGPTIVDPSAGTLISYGLFPTQLQSVVEATGAVAWTTALPTFAPAAGSPPLAIDAQSGIVYLADTVSATVLTVNANTGSPGASILLPVGANATALAVDSVHHLLYVGETRGQVQIFGSVTGSLDGTVSAPFLTACAGAADSVLTVAYFVNCGGPVGNVTTIQFAGFNTGRVFAVGFDPVSIVWDPRGELIVANLVSDNLTTIQVSNGARGAIPLGVGQPRYIAEDASDGLLAVAGVASAWVQMLDLTNGFPLGIAYTGNATGGLAFDNTSGTFVVAASVAGSGALWSRVAMPSAPTGLAVRPTNNTLAVNWTAS